MKKYIFSILCAFVMHTFAVAQTDSIKTFADDKFRPAAEKGGVKVSTADVRTAVNMLANAVNKKASRNEALPHIIQVIGTLPSSGNTSYKGYFAKENNGSVITAYVDSSGNRHAYASPDLSNYASKTALADSITNVKSKDSIIFYSGVIRNTNGAFGFIEDGQHAAINITSVNTLSNNQIEIGLTEGTTTSLVAVPDESYAARKIRCGTSVGSNLAVISMFSDEGLDGRVYWNGSNFALGSVNGLWYRSSADALITWNTTNSARPFIRFEHPNSVFTTAQITNLLLNNWYGSSVNTYTPKLKAVGNNYFEFYFVNAAGTIVTTPDFFCDIVFNRGGTYAIKNEYSQVSSSNIWLLGQAKK